MGEFADVDLDEVDEFPTFAVFLDEVKVGLVLEGVLELDDPIVLEDTEEFLLDHCLVFLLLPLQSLLLDLLHCVDLPVAVLYSKKHIPVCSLSQSVL